MGSDPSHGHLCDPLAQGARRCWIAVGLLLYSLLRTLHPWAGEAGPVPLQASPPQDSCQPMIQRSAEHLRQILDARLMRGFPMTAQLDEGNARLSPLSILSVDCAQLHVVASGHYEFRGNLGVMDLTRRGTTVLQFRLNPKPKQQQLWLEEPEVLEI